MPYVVKGQIAPSTASRRTQIINAVTTAVQSLSAVGSCVASADAGTNGLRLKYRFSSQQDAQTIYDTALNAAVTRAPQAGSFLRLRDTTRTLLAERNW
jgi:hypothetical protein